MTTVYPIQPDHHCELPESPWVPIDEPLGPRPSDGVHMCAVCGRYFDLNWHEGKHGTLGDRGETVWTVHYWRQSHKRLTYEGVVAILGPGPWART